jgi:hypothetical protein
VLRVAAPVYGPSALLPYLGDLRDAFDAEARGLAPEAGRVSICLLQMRLCTVKVVSTLMRTPGSLCTCVCAHV